MYVPSERGITEASQTGGTKTKKSKKTKSDIPESTTRGVKRNISSNDTVVSDAEPSGLLAGENTLAYVQAERKILPLSLHSASRP